MSKGHLEALWEFFRPERPVYGAHFWTFSLRKPVYEAKADRRGLSHASVKVLASYTFAVCCNNSHAFPRFVYHLCKERWCVFCLRWWGQWTFRLTRPIGPVSSDTWIVISLICPPTSAFVISCCGHLGKVAVLFSAPRLLPFHESEKRPQSTSKRRCPDDAKYHRCSMRIKFGFQSRILVFTQVFHFSCHLCFNFDKILCNASLTMRTWWKSVCIC